MDLKIMGLTNHNFATKKKKKKKYVRYILWKMGWQSLLHGQMNLNLCF